MKRVDCRPKSLTTLEAAHDLQCEADWGVSTQGWGDRGVGIS